MAGKIFIPLQPVISCFLEPAVNRWVAVGAAEGFWSSYSPVCPEGPTLLCTLVLLPKWMGVPLSLIFLVPRIRPMKPVSTGQVFSRFAVWLWRIFLGIFFPLLFPPVLQLLSPSMPLLAKYWASHCLSISESCVWNHLPKTGTQTHVAGILCYA